MKTNGSKQMGAALLCAVLLMGLPFFIACGGSKAKTQEAQLIQVQVTDDHIQMPNSLPTGKTTFQVTNTGSQEHSLEITGPAGDQKLEAALKPGESGSLEMYLDTGTYRVYCPIDQSHGGSMQLALNVHPDTTGGRG
ncbi:MAG TPA: cupredoxin domain-containing protein [Thermoanaerobaculia bacterium]|nr:cupredoxin domain-containing protein [Thermoanaerobaculia bacterium]